MTKYHHKQCENFHHSIIVKPVNQYKECGAAAVNMTCLMVLLYSPGNFKLVSHTLLLCSPFYHLSSHMFDSCLSVLQFYYSITLSIFKYDSLFTNSHVLKYKQYKIRHEEYYYT